MKRGLLLSGGVDSICMAYGLKPEFAYTIDYGQIPASREIYVSKLICDLIGIKHRVIQVDCSSLGSGTLVNKESLDVSPSSEWWPYRNQLLITLALMQCVKDEINELHLASVKSDCFHCDGNREFYRRMNDLVSYQEGNINIKCESLEYYSHELALKYNVPLNILSLAHSCHTANLACGKCSGCLKQLRVRYELALD